MKAIIKQGGIMNFGQFLKNKRKELLKPMAVVAAELGITISYLSDVESSRRNPFPFDKKDIYEKLARILQVQYEDLLALAIDGRNKTIMDLSKANIDLKTLVYSFTRKVEDGDLTPENIKQITQVLEGAKHSDLHRTESSSCSASFN